MSCLSATFCEGIGSYDDASSASRSVFEQFSNGTWSATEAPELGPDTKFESVSCWDVGACVAVGSYKDTADSRAPIIATLSDGSWSTELAPLPMDAVTGEPGALNWLKSVSCPSAGTCVAVGQYKDSSATLGLVETLAGGTWQGTARRRAVWCCH